MSSDLKIEKDIHNPYTFIRTYNKCSILFNFVPEIFIQFNFKSIDHNEYYYTAKFMYKFLKYNIYNFDTTTLEENLHINFNFPDKYNFFKIMSDIFK